MFLFNNNNSLEPDITKILSSDVKKDLHIHTCYSDGDLTPQQVVDRWLKEGFKLISITDHDGIEGSMSVMDYTAGMDIRIDATSKEAACLLNVIDAGVVPGHLLTDALRTRSRCRAGHLESAGAAERLVVSTEYVLHRSGGAIELPALTLNLPEFLAVLCPLGKYRHRHQEGGYDKNDSFHATLLL